MKFFHIIQLLNVLASLIVVIYFFIGIMDGTVTGRNMGMWLILLLVIGAMIAGSMMLYKHEKFVLAWILAGILVLPTLLALIYVVMVVLGVVRWN
jgi:hypothetical protein